MANAQRVRGNQTIEDDLIVGAVIYSGEPTTGGATRSWQAQGSASDITLQVVPKGVGTFQVPSGYESNVADDKDVINLGWAKAHIAGQNVSAAILTPGAYDKYVVGWDDANTRFDMVLGANYVVDSEPGSTYSFTEADNHKVIRFTNASGVTATIPTGLSPGWRVYPYRAAGAGLVTIASLGTLEGTGTTIPTAATKAEIFHRGSDIHVLSLAAGGGGGGVSDGNKGDITVSGSGGTWTINNDAVTFAKMQNSDVAGISVIGKSGAGAGNFAEIASTIDDQVFRRAGGVLGWGTINIASAQAISGVLAIANGGTGLSAIGAAGTVLISDGSVASWSNTPSKPINTTTYDLIASDNGKFLYLTNSSGCTLNIPNGLPANMSVVIFRAPGAGDTTITCAGTYEGLTNQLLDDQTGASLYQRTTNVWSAMGAFGAAGGGGGAGTFLSLSDTPSSYSAQAGKYVAVNATNDGLIFVNSPIQKEVPVGLINGVNTTYTLSSAPTGSSEMVFLNGQLLQSGAGNDYTISGNVITMLYPPQVTDKIIVTFSGGGTVGLTDGDKGDITVASSGAAWTIDPKAVTLAKIQDISTTVILGRISGGSGVTEQLNPTQATSMLNTFTLTAKGLVTAPGTLNGYFLKDDGSWAAAGGGGGGITNGAAANEMMKSDGTNAVASGIFSTSHGNVVFGSNAGGSRTLTAGGSGANVSISMISKGTGNVYLDAASGQTIISRGVLYLGDAGVALANGQLLATGSGTNVGMYLSVKGSAQFSMDAGPTGTLNLGNGRTGAISIDHATGDHLYVGTFTIKTTAGSAGHPDSYNYTVAVADAYNASGNGNGGAISFTTGLRRVSGGGTDGNFVVNARTAVVDFTSNSLVMGNNADSREINFTTVGSVNLINSTGVNFQFNTNGFAFDLVASSGITLKADGLSSDSLYRSGRNLNVEAGTSGKLSLLSGALGTVEAIGGVATHIYTLSGGTISIGNNNSHLTINVDAGALKYITINGLPNSSPGSNKMWVDGSGYLRLT